MIKETKPTIKNPKEYPLKILVNLSWIGILNVSVNSSLVNKFF